MICTIIAVCSIVVNNLLWFLGDIYWLLLACLLIIAVIASIRIFIANPGQLLLRTFVIVLLIVGQWWAIQIFAAQVVWRIVGFAP